MTTSKKPDKYRDETHFKNTFLKHMKAAGMHAQRHEDKNATGIPDVDYGHNGVNGWIEFKFQNGKIRAAQLQWMDKRVKVADHVYLIRGLRDGGAYLIDWKRFEVLVKQPSIPLKEWVESLAGVLGLPPDLGAQRRQILPPLYLVSQDREALSDRIGPSPVTLVSDRG